MWLEDEKNLWSFSKTCCWHAGCWRSPKLYCIICKLILTTDLAVRRHCCSQRRTPKKHAKAVDVAWRHNVPSVRLCVNVSRCSLFSYSDYCTATSIHADNLQNRYSLPHMSMKEWRLFGWHHVTKRHPTFPAVPKSSQAQFSVQACLYEYCPTSLHDWLTLSKINRHIASCSSTLLTPTVLKSVIDNALRRVFSPTPKPPNYDQLGKRCTVI